MWTSSSARIRSTPFPGHPDALSGPRHCEGEPHPGLGIDLDAITRELLQNGLQSFADSFQALLDSIAQKRDQLMEDRQRMVFFPGPYEAIMKAVIFDLDGTLVQTEILKAKSYARAAASLCPHSERRLWWQRGKMSP